MVSKYIIELKYAVNQKNVKETMDLEKIIISLPTG